MIVDYSEYITEKASKGIVNSVYVENGLPLFKHDSICPFCKQKIENVMDISDEEIETFISENRNPLIEKKEKLKKMIGLYSERINTVDNQNQYKSERERSEHVR